MSKKRTTYSAEFKAKTVLEILEGEKTLNEIASQYSLLPKNLQNWTRCPLSESSHPKPLIFPRIRGFL